MLYFVRDAAGTLVDICEIRSEAAQAGTRCFENRNDWRSLADAERVAEDATRLRGEVYLAVDHGEHVYPRYDVVRAPRVGDLASYSFNGDAYPCGKIVRVSGSLRKVTTEDERGVRRDFYRRRLTGSWIHDQTWSLMRGHHSIRNPSF